MPASHWHLIRPPIPVGHTMPKVEKGALTPENVIKTFPRCKYQQLVVNTLIHAATAHCRKGHVWSGVNYAYLERCASSWWIKEIKKSPFGIFKSLWFSRGYVLYMMNIAMSTLLRAKLLEELIEWDRLEQGKGNVTSNQDMPVYYPAAELVHHLNLGIATKV